jgi:hypothetical protein
MRARARLAVLTGLTLALGLAPATAAVAEDAPGIQVKENPGSIKATGPGFTVLINRDGVRTVVDEDELGDPSTGNPVQRSVLDLAGRTLAPFVCANGTYTIRTGTFTRTFRVSVFAPRPAPYTAGFNTANPGFLTPFVGVLDGTVTDQNGETLRFLISDLVYEARTADGGFRSQAPIHGIFVDEEGRVRDRISLFGRFRSGPGGTDARFSVVDRGTCRERRDLPQFGPGAENAVVTGPLFVLPFDAPVIVP